MAQKLSDLIGALETIWTLEKKKKRCKSLQKIKIWRLWNGTERIRINRAAGEDMEAEERIKLCKSL